MINKLTKLSTHLWVEHCLAVLLLLTAPIASTAADRPMAGADNQFRQQLFVERANSEDLSSFDSAGGQYLGRLSIPAGDSSFGLMVIVDQDRDLTQRNLETTLLDELGLSGWPVFVVSLGRSPAESGQTDSLQAAHTDILKSALQEFQQRSVRQVVVLTSDVSLQTSSQLAAQSELISHVIYRLPSGNSRLSKAPDTMAGMSELQALADSKVGLVDLVPPSMSKKMLAARKRALTRAQLDESYGYIYVPGFQRQSNFEVIAKRLRVWMKENRLGLESS